MKKIIYVDDQQVSWRESMTVEDLLAELEDQHHCVVIRLNSKYISKPNFKNTVIPANAQIHLIPMIAGG